MGVKEKMGEVRVWKAMMVRMVMRERMQARWKIHSKRENDKYTAQAVPLLIFS